MIDPVQETTAFSYDGKQFKLKVETGLSGVPEALAGNQELNTPAKIETRLKTELPSVAFPEANIAVYDVTLLVSTDQGQNWEEATEANFPSGGLTVTDGKGNELELTARGGGRYTFQMPGGKVSIEARFAEADEEHDCPALAFRDLDSGAWYHEAVDYVLSEGIMSGCGGGRFAPDETLSRAQLAQILYNRAGRPALTGASPFPDVADGRWYTDAILWANGNGIVTGYGNGLFGPNDPVTREPLAVMLWWYAGSPVSGEELAFPDADEVSGFALEAVQWAGANGIIHGSGGVLAPKDSATRAQAAQMLRNFFEDN